MRYGSRAYELYEPEFLSMYLGNQTGQWGCKSVFQTMFLHLCSGAKLDVDSSGVRYLLPYSHSDVDL